MSAVAATARLSRLLTLVPWLLNRPGVELTEAARHFKITEQQLVRDLELLFVCGTPGHMPDDLISAEWDSGRIYLSNADAIARPLRLDADEAIALLAGLRTLADLGDVGDRRAVDSALVKLSAAAQEAVSPASRLAIDLTPGQSGVEQALRTAREALRLRRRLRLHYLVPARDEITERDVDPMQVTSIDGRWYLEAWCHRAEGVRLFRFDRVAGLSLLDVDGTPPPEAVSRAGDEQLFTPSDDDLRVTLEVEPRGRWVAEYYPAEETTELPGGRMRIVLRVASPDWIPRLVLRLGGAGRIVDPPGLAAQVVVSATEALAGYEGPEAVGSGSGSESGVGSGVGSPTSSRPV
ncbi:WYL domain-containing protein [Kineosporia sp. J2-2]|uniref:WYL domain-containing protein n=1 Tax=Kineosporia corallincola TaxID=2835133 RepID=A0ABS5TPH0_9ACTN|nr:WYL domain-containing protein [Kineosporia corallincola]MBT0771943.1 WYL domain-containing protein [Kineosporia corallincola]